MRQTWLSYFDGSFHPLYWALAFFAIAALRVYYCFETPLYTTDVLRNIGYGAEFWFYSFGVYDRTPHDFTPELHQYFWPNHHYTYPAATLLIYAIIAKLWASIFFAKLVWTLLDCLNAWLIYRISKDRWCALLYFAHPIGIWFASHEGQFEPLVNSATLLGFLCLQTKKPIAFFFLTLAAQTKLFPVFLFPYFAIKFLREDCGAIARCLLWCAAGLLPSVAAAWDSGYLATLFLPGYVPKLNPISWALFHEGMHGFTPFPLVLIHWLAGLGFIGVCLWMMQREQKFLPYLAPMVFVAFVKMIPMGQFWYLLIAPAMCMGVENPTHRRVLFAMTWLFGVRSLWSILIGPIGYQNPAPVMDILRSAMFGL